MSLLTSYQQCQGTFLLNISTMMKYSVDLLIVVCLQIDRLVRAGANVLASICVGPYRQIGTVVDYAHYVYNLVSDVCHDMCNLCLYIK